MTTSRNLPKMFMALLYCLVVAPAYAGATNGPNALALAALAAEYSPEVPSLDKRLLAAYFDGRANAPHAKGKTVTVKADAIDCRASNVDITERSCELSFGAKKVTLRARRAHELYATLVENGVPADGAAGSIHESVTALECLVDADEIAEKGGGGARCAFNP